MQFVCVWLDLHSDMPFGCAYLGYLSTFSCNIIVNKFYRTRNTYILALRVQYQKWTPKNVVSLNCMCMFLCAKNIFSRRMERNSILWICSKKEKKKNKIKRTRKKTSKRDWSGSRSKAQQPVIITYIMTIIRTPIERATAFVVQKKVKSRHE